MCKANNFHVKTTGKLQREHQKEKRRVLEEVHDGICGRWKKNNKNVLGKTQVEVREKLKTALVDYKQIDISKSENLTVASWILT